MQLISYGALASNQIISSTLTFLHWFATSISILRLVEVGTTSTPSSAISIATWSTARSFRQCPQNLSVNTLRYRHCTTKHLHYLLPPAQLSWIAYFKGVYEMLARSSLSTLSRRTLNLISFSTLTARAPLISTNVGKQQDSSVSVVSYRDGQRQHEEALAKGESNGPVTPPGNDLQKIAQPLNPSIYSQLTPTMNKFTLRDKVAVITGYVKCKHRPIFFANQS